MSFSATFTQFLNELKETFPEFASEIDKVRDQPIESNRSTFLKTWRSQTSDVTAKNSEIFNESGISIVGDFTMTKKLWSELSANTQNAIWKYLSSLLLLAASESTEGWDLSGFQHDLEEMMKKMKETFASGAGAAAGAGSDTGAGEGDDGGLPGLGNMKEIFEKISKMASTFGFKDFDGMKDKFKLPERMFKGHLAKIVQELVKEFKPEDFGITAEMVEGNDPTKVFEILQDIFTKKPELLATAAQKIAKKIQAKFQNGEIRREDIINEVEELMKEFSENEMFSSLFGSIGEMMKSSEKSSGNEGSARRREVQERLRKKKAEKDASKNAEPQSNTIVTQSAVLEADAMAAALLLEEPAKPAKKGGKKK